MAKKVVKKTKIKLLNILLIVLIICLIYSIRGLWIGIFTKIVANILPFLIFRNLLITLEVL